MTPTLDQLVARAAGLVAGRYYGTGAIVGVLDRGRVAVEALGHGLHGQMRADGVMELHCAAKPIMALVLDELLDVSGLGDPRVGELIEVRPTVREVRTSSLTNHSAGLRWPPALHWVASPPHARPDASSIDVTAGRSSYSEVAAGLLIEQIVAALGGARGPDVVDQQLIGWLGSTDELTLSSRRIGLAGRLEPVFGRLPDRPLPMLHPLHDAYQERQSPAFGGFATASAYLKILDRVLSRLADGVAGRTSRWVNRGRSMDVTLGRAADFRGGFLVGGGEWEEGVHFAVATLANLMVATLPAQRWGAIVFLNGAIFDVEEASFTRRVIFADLLRSAQRPDQDRSR